MPSKSNHELEVEDSKLDVMKLLDFPNELLVAIIHSVDGDGDLDALARTCRLVYAMANSHLYTRDSQREPGESRALTWAAEHDRVEAITRVIEATGAPASWVPLLDLAVDNDSAAVVAFLIDQQGVDPNVTTDSNTETEFALLISAVESQAERVVRLLLGRDDVDPNIIVTDEYGGETNAVKEAADRLYADWYRSDREAEKTQERRVLELLLDHPATNIDVDREKKLSSLYWTIAQDGHGSEELFRMLRAKGMERNPMMTNSRRDLFSFAAGAAEPGIVRIMLDDGEIDPDTRYEDGRTPLSYAMTPMLSHSRFESDLCSEAEVARVLLETGRVNVDSKDHTGRTPLRWKMENGYRGSDDVVKVLLSYHATIPVIENEDADLKKFLRTAVEGNNPILSEILFDQLNRRCPLTPQEGRELLSDLMDRDCGEPIVRLLLQKAEIDYTYDGFAGSSVIGEAASRDRYDLLELLLAQPGVDLNAVGANGESGVSSALDELRDAVGSDSDGSDAKTVQNRAAFVERLLIHPDLDMHTVPADYVEWYVSDLARYDQQGIIELLIRRDGRIHGQFTVTMDEKENIEQPLLGWAQERGHETIVQLLQDRDIRMATDKPEDND